MPNPPTDSPSLQPLAPQAPGDLLAGRFGKFGDTAMQNWKKVAVVVVVVFAVWWIWKKYA